MILLQMYKWIMFFQMLLLLPSLDLVINNEEKLKLTNWALTIFWSDSSRSLGERDLYVTYVAKAHKRKPIHQDLNRDCTGNFVPSVFCLCMFDSTICIMFLWPFFECMMYLKLICSSRYLDAYSRINVTPAEGWWALPAHILKLTRWLVWRKVLWTNESYLDLTSCIYI